jgi:drug/metabolite transporter (DMT)-like permease
MARTMTLVAGVLWGTSFITTQWALQDGFGPLTLATVRFLLATVAALAFALVARSVGAGLLKNPWLWALGITNAAGYVFQNYALDLTTGTKAALITNLSMVLVAPMSYMWFREPFTRTKVLGLIAVIPGVLLLTTNGDLSQLHGSQFVGDMLILGAGASWAVYIVIAKRLLDTTPATTPALTLWVMATTTLVLAPFSALAVMRGGEGVGSIGAVGWAGALYTGIGCSTVAYLLYTRGLRGVTATVSAILLLVQVFVAAVLAYALQDVGLGPVALVGAIITLAAMILVSLAGGKERGARAE